MGHKIMHAMRVLRLLALVSSSPSSSSGWGAVLPTAECQCDDFYRQTECARGASTVKRQSFYHFKPLGGCGRETARTCAFGMGWGVNVTKVRKCVETASSGPVTPIPRSVRLRKRMGGTCGQAEVGLRRRTDRPPDASAPRAPDAPRTTQMSVVAVLRSVSMLCRCGATQ